MATNQVPEQYDRWELSHDLFDILCEHRRGVHQDKMVRHLLQFSRGSTELVALIEETERAMFYNSLSRAVYAVPFDKDGIDEDNVESLWRHVGEAGSWVDSRGKDFDWVHPRYHWAIELMNSEWRNVP